jgi:hypothetical protein
MKRIVWSGYFPCADAGSDLKAAKDNDDTPRARTSRLCMMQSLLGQSTGSNQLKEAGMPMRVHSSGKT